MKNNIQINHNLEEAEERIARYIGQRLPRFTPKPIYLFDEFQQLIKNIINSAQLNSRDVTSLVKKYPTLHEKVFWQLSKKYWHACVTDNVVPTPSDVVVDTFAILRKLHSKMQPKDIIEEGVVVPTLV